MTMPDVQPTSRKPATDESHADATTFLASGGIQHRLNLALQMRKKLTGQPGVLFEPPVVTWAGVRQWKDRGGVCPPALNGRCERDSFGAGQPLILRVFPDQHRQPNAFHLRQQSIMPQFRTFFARRQIAGVTGAGIAKPHRNQSHNTGVIKLCPCDSCPVSQPITARVIPWNARLVDSTPGRLADDQNSCVGICLDDRTWIARKVLFALPTLANIIQQHWQFRHNPDLWQLSTCS
jgi:hypothetical protein